MSYISKEDYWGLIKLENLNDLIQNQDLALEAEQDTAVEMVKSYLYNRYDTVQIFSKQGNERDLRLVRHAVNIVLYNIYQRYTNARDLPLKAKNYDDTIIWLEKVNDGKIGLDLPRKEANDKPITKFRGASNQTQRNHNTDYIQ